MQPTTINLHTKFQIGPVDPRIFGGFLEHMGRAVYQGVFDPESTLADENGFRTDVLKALQKLKMAVMRYPGGNFASGYHWTDGVGSIENRPTVKELAWNSIESNRFGTDEYINLCREMDWIPMLCANLGTGTPEEARNWVEYCNCPEGTRYADMRAANGNSESFNVRLWCLGNEMDGSWQLGHVPAEQYAIRAQQAAKMMKAVDGTIELVVCGSSLPGLPTYMEWDRQVLEYVGDYADYISLHNYVGNHSNDTADFLAVTNAIDRQIEEIDSVCRFAQAKKGSPKRAWLCFDEWNVWYKNFEIDGEGKFAPHLIEEVYNLEDALVIAGFLHSFVRHADMVKIANLAQIVNVIAPILTRDDEMLIQSIFYPFEMFSSRRDGISLGVDVEGSGYESPSNGYARYIDASAILDERKLHLFATNRSQIEDAEIRVKVADSVIAAFESGELLTGSGPKVANSFDEPDLVDARPFKEVSLSDGQLTCKLPPLSLAAMTVDLE